ncbi:MAG: IS1595 family transposase, partial [Bacteroidales bacterium]|nr:IS1595 family transposase [Bacteroidales bacterium]
QGRSYDTKKTKVVCAVEVSDTGKIKRGYAKVIDDYSANSIESIFSEHIGTTAQIKTDEWSAYKKLSKTYSIEQEKSMAGMNFKEIHTIIRNLKTWLRTIQTHIDKGHTQKYLDEFFYRLNRSIHKETIFR